MFLLWGKHIRKYYLRYGIFFLIGVAALVTVDYFQLRIPEVIGNIVDKLNNEGSIDVYSPFFRENILTVITVALVMFLGRITWRVSLFFASKKIEERIRNEMFLKAESLDIAYYHSNKVGNIMNWFINDIETLEEFLGWGSLMMIDGLFLTALALAKMFMLNSSLAFISLIPVLLIAIWGAIVEKRMSEMWRIRQESNDKIYDFSQESFTGIRVIKAFVKEQQQISEFRKAAENNRDINVKFTYISVLFDVVIELIIALIVAIIVGFGGWFVYGTITGNPVVIFNISILLSPGQLITFFGYFSSLIWPMIALGQVVTMFSKASASYKRIAHFLDSNADVKDSETAIDVNIKGKIEFKNFSFKYPDGDSECLKDISLTINPGEKIGIIGTVGSGKSTLVNVLLRLYNVSPNTLFIDNTDIMDIKLKSLRNGISIAPQDNFLFSDTLARNIAFGRQDAAQEEIEAAAKAADVHDNIMDFPEGYETLVGERGVTLSGGQKQRSSIARALLKDSPLLILDDALSAVDTDTEETILENLRRLRAGKTTILIAHRVSTVQNADHVLVLADGAVAEYGTADELMERGGVFRSMVEKQRLEQQLSLEE